MDNQYNKDGADLRAAWAPNKDYATVAANIAACMFAIANDRNAWVFADNEGNVYKTLQDASGDANIPDESVLIADSAGRATSDANFTFDGTNLRLPQTANIDFGDQTSVGDVRISVSPGSFIIKKWNGSSYTIMFEAF